LYPSNHIKLSKLLEKRFGSGLVVSGDNKIVPFWLPPFRLGGLAGSINLKR